MGLPFNVVQLDLRAAAPLLQELAINPRRGIQHCFDRNRSRELGGETCPRTCCTGACVIVLRERDVVGSAQRSVRQVTAIECEPEEKLTAVC